MAKTIKLEITEKTRSEAGYAVNGLPDEEMKSRAYINALGSEVLTEYLAQNGLQTSEARNLHSIHKILGEFDISDIMLENIHIDVRVIFDEDYIFIPKSHFEYNLVPDIYVILRLEDEQTEFLGFVEPRLIDKTLQNEEYYFVKKEDLTPPSELVGFVKTYHGETDAVLSDEEMDYAQSVMVSLADNEIEESDKKYLLEQLTKSAQLRDKFIEFETFETLAHKATATEAGLNVSAEGGEVGTTGNVMMAVEGDELDELNQLGEIGEIEGIDELGEVSESDKINAEATDEEIDLDDLFADSETDTEPALSLDLDTINLDDITAEDLETANDDIGNMKDIENIDLEMGADLSSAFSELEEFATMGADDVTENNNVPEVSQTTEWADISEIPDFGEFGGLAAMGLSGNTAGTPESAPQTVNNEISFEPEFMESMDLDGMVQDFINTDEGPATAEKTEESRLSVLYNESEKESDVIFSEEKISDEEGTTVKKLNKFLVPAAALAIFVVGAGVFMNMKSSNGAVAEQPTDNNMESPGASNPLDAPTTDITMNVPASVTPTAPTAVKPSNTDLSNINKVAANTPISTYLSVKKVVWEVPDYLTYSEKFKEYLGSTGRNIKSSLSTDLLLSTEYPYSKVVRADIKLSQSGNVEDVRLGASSGSTEIDKMVLQSVKSTLNAIKPPSGEAKTPSYNMSIVIYL